MTTHALRAGLLLTEGLGACARIAVEERVSERAYLALAKSLYRSLAGEPKGGRPSASHGAWDPLLQAVGGQTALAREVGVTRLTVQRWVSGATTPRERDAVRLRALAKRRGVAAPTK